MQKRLKISSKDIKNSHLGAAAIASSHGLLTKPKKGSEIIEMPFGMTTASEAKKLDTCNSDDDSLSVSIISTDLDMVNDLPDVPRRMQTHEQSRNSNYSKKRICSVDSVLSRSNTSTFKGSQITIKNQDSSNRFA